jgi:peptide/nickel transport system ATP-binding protein
MGQILQVENLTVAFKIGNTYVNAVEDCSFSLQQAKTLGIVGESGCGKSVTSLALMRLIQEPPGKIAKGRVLLEDQNLLALSKEDMRLIRGNRMSMIFQEPMTSLNPVFTVGDQIAEVFITHKQASRKEARDLSIAMLEQVHIPDAASRFDDYPHQLSGGMRQRIMIAMALACQPLVLIADEPTTALDVTIQAQILALMNRLQQKNKMSTILITHDLGVVAETCDDVIVMYAGRIVERTSTKDLFSSPLHPYTQGLLESIPRLGQKKERLPTIAGIVPSLGKFPHGCRFRDRCPLASAECAQAEPLLEEKKAKHMVACFKVPSR